MDKRREIMRRNTPFYTYIKRLKKFRFYHIIVYALLGLIMFALMYSNVTPENLQLSIGDKADRNLRAPQFTIDTEKTEEKRNEAAGAVEHVYVLDEEKAVQQVERIHIIIDSVETTKQEVAKLGEQEVLNEEGEIEIQQVDIPLEEQMAILQEKLTSKLPSDWRRDIQEEDLITLLNADFNQLSVLRNATITAVHNAMQQEILTVADRDDARKSFETEMRITSIPGDSENTIRNVGINIGKIAIIPNKFYDSKATQDERQAAKDAVEPVEIATGQLLVKEGETITRELHRQLEVAGLLNTNKSIFSYVGLALLIAIMLASLVYLFNGKEISSHNKNSYLTMYLIIFTITLLIMKVISLFQQFENAAQIGFIAPVAMGAMLTKMLINERTAVITSIIFGICGSIIYNEFPGTLNYSLGIYLLVSSVAGVLFLSQHNRRSTILQAGMFISLINVGMIISLLAIKNTNFFMMNGLLNLGTNITMAVGSGVVAAVLTIGLLPFFEAGFGMLSTMKLLELSNPNHPLLRKILMETPGTYHHSVMVANLAESACEAVGANGLLARVASYYHDIGKTKRPNYFIENQMGRENPHDKLPPQTSKNIIVAHATDGAEILRQHNMPKEIIDIAAEHHGTSLLKFFYHKAKEQNSEVEEQEYRYPGPKAQSKEAAIVGTADSIEAAVRSLNNPTPERIETIVKAIIKDRIQDEQYSECDITFKELELISQSFCETLQGIFHSRIEYPEAANKKVEGK